MRKYTYFLLGLLCGAVFFSGTAVMANSGVLAQITSQIFFLNGEQTELFAYNINGNNYVKLRDAAALFGADIEYIEETNSVHMEIPKKEEVPEDTPVVTPDIFIDGTSSSKEDFSANANQSIFGDIYTKEAYNTMRQTVADTKSIIDGNNADGYNPTYSYAHYVDTEFTFTTPGKTDTAMKSVANVLSGYYTYSFGAEPTVKNLYEYPGYRILKVQVNPKYESANTATDEFIGSIETLSEKEKVKAIATYIADRIVYKDENVAGINDVFTSSTPVNGICGTYANAFIYLCQRADIPCVTIKDATHAWNEIFIDGRWQIIDVSYYDVARTDESLFTTNYPRIDTTKDKTEFAKELLVPGNTAD
ncbi:MAG: transglutaminase domain-containing protein [Ruminococcus sp.]|nr:transglutaminase domain-containing protein [Ruminococcus sp.]